MSSIHTNVVKRDFIYKMIANEQRSTRNDSKNVQDGYSLKNDSNRELQRIFSFYRYKNKFPSLDRSQFKIKSGNEF